MRWRLAVPGILAAAICLGGCSGAEIAAGAAAVGTGLAVYQNARAPGGAPQDPEAPRPGASQAARALWEIASEIIESKTGVGKSGQAATGGIGLLWAIVAAVFGRRREP